MNDHDENVTRVGPFIIGKSYKLDELPASWARPKEALSAFLNTDSTDENQVDDYCQKYKYIPSDCSQSWAKGFANDQAEVKKIVKYYQKHKNRLNNRDVLLHIVNSINNHITGCITTFAVVNRAKLTQLDLDSDRVVNFGENYVIRINKASSPLALIWLDLADAIITSQKLKECKGCGKYFIISGSKHNQQYCPGRDCSGPVRAKKYRQRKKASR